MDSTLQRVIKFTPAFDKRHKNPSKNYGIHGVNLQFWEFLENYYNQQLVTPKGAKASA